MPAKTWKWWFTPLILLVILAADQWLKYWVKTNMYLGEEIHMLGDWFILHFTENNGMAFGLEAGGRSGKLFLTSFRIIAVLGIIWYLRSLIQKKAGYGLLFCVSLVLAGAIGNIIDSVFYGVWYAHMNPDYYADEYFFGRVVDMFYFPIIQTTWPSWVPVFGGSEFIFFRPVFNIADAAISTGVISILVFQKSFFPPVEEPQIDEESEGQQEVDTKQEDLEEESESDSNSEQD
jgi:signal peptidase II